VAITMAAIGRYLWQCVSTDTKPAPPTYSPSENDLLLVTDTQAFYVYISGTWVSSTAVPPMLVQR
jgi:hypothetical protein